MNIRKFGTLILLIINVQILFAAAPSSNNTILDWLYSNIFLTLGAIVFLLALLALYYSNNTLLDEVKQNLNIEDVTSDTQPNMVKSGFLSKISTYLAGLKPMDKEADLDMGHEFDGIRELDNSLPPWWLYMFYFTIAFSAIYMYLYVFSDKGVRQADEYVLAIEKAELDKISALRTQANKIDETTVTLLTDEASLNTGKEIFLSQCAACHGVDGQGIIGPNFTDKYWIHGGDIKDLFKVIKYGVPDKGMISWQTQMNPETMQKVASYVLTLEGKQVDNGKAPEGELYERQILTKDTL